MAVQIAGSTNSSTLAEVDVNTKALHAVLRAEDVQAGSLGAYSVSQASGTMNAGISAASPIFCFRYPGANIALVKRVLFSSGGIGAFTAGVASFQLFFARSFTASDTAGTDITPATGKNRLRTSFGDSGLVGTAGCVRIGSTGPIVAGTRTLDTNPLSSITGSMVNTAGTPMMAPNSILLDQRPGEYPCVLATNEGLVIQATVPATGTWTFSATVVWLELQSY